MRYKEIEYKNKKLVRINAKKAREIYMHPKKYNGVTLYMLPVNTNPDSIWINGFFELTMNYTSMDATDNMRYINELIYYNCNDELGNYLKYYIEDSTYEERWFINKYFKSNCIDTIISVYVSYCDMYR